MPKTKAKKQKLKHKTLLFPRYEKACPHNGKHGKLVPKKIVFYASEALGLVAVRACDLHIHDYEGHGWLVVSRDFFDKTPDSQLAELYHQYIAQKGTEAPHGFMAWLKDRKLAL